MTEQAQSRIHIGTSGWSYDHWRGPFYPESLSDEKWLEYYAAYLHSVEINNSFYQLPGEKTLQHWYKAVPENFIFTVKASRYITHMKKLKNPAKSLSTFLSRISVLDNKLGPVLFQLPPRWHFNAGRLAAFLDMLSDEFSYAFEFRDHGWHNPQTYDLLAQQGAAFCIYELDGFLSPREVTANFVYVRLHGPDGSYQGSYDNHILSGWAGAFTSWLSAGQDIYCYFDNDQDGYAVQNARSLQSMLQK